MARFKPRHDRVPRPLHQALKLLQVDFEQQVTAAVLNAHYAIWSIMNSIFLFSMPAIRNDVDGAFAYDPAVLIKISLLAQSRGNSEKLDMMILSPYLQIGITFMQDYASFN